MEKRSVRERWCHAVSPAGDGGDRQIEGGELLGKRVPLTVVVVRDSEMSARRGECEDVWCKQDCTDCVRILARRVGRSNKEGRPSMMLMISEATASILQRDEVCWNGATEWDV